MANSVEGLATMKPSVAMIDGNVVKDGAVVKENYARYEKDKRVIDFDCQENFGKKIPRNLG